MMRELPALEGVVKLALPSSAPLGPAGATRTVWEGEPAAVEIVAPDRFCAHVFLNLMGSLFPFELVGTGTSWVIRLRPHGSAWEGRLLLLVQRWLETCPLPCATIGYGGRRYIFRSALTQTAIRSGFDGSHGLEPPPADRASQPKLRSPVRTARAASPSAGSRQTQIALVTKP
jgi:hypothetical protein